MSETAETAVPASPKRPYQAVSPLVAGYLQKHPKSPARIGDICAATGLTRHQVANALQHFVRDRDDVIRVRPGVYSYIPGKGKRGIVAGRNSRKPELAGPAAPDRPLEIYTGVPASGITTVAGVSLSTVVTAQTGPRQFTEVTWAKLAGDGIVAQDDNGVLYKVSELA